MGVPKDISYRFSYCVILKKRLAVIEKIKKMGYEERIARDIELNLFNYFGEKKEKKKKEKKEEKQVEGEKEKETEEREGKEKEKEIEKEKEKQEEKEYTYAH